MMWEQETEGHIMSWSGSGDIHTGVCSVTFLLCSSYVASNLSTIYILGEASQRNLPANASHRHTQRGHSKPSLNPVKFTVKINPHRH